MASGLPVLATAVGDTDLVADGATGIVVPAGEPLTMARHLAALASDPARALALGQHGRQRVLDKFNLQALMATDQTICDQQLRPAAVSTR